MNVPQSDGLKDDPMKVLVACMRLVDKGANINQDQIAEESCRRNDTYHTMIKSADGDLVRVFSNLNIGIKCFKCAE